MLKVTRIVIRTPTIPVSVGTFETFVTSATGKTVTVTKIVARTPTILVSVGTLEIFDIQKRRQLPEWHLRGLKNEDSYEDSDLDTHHPCDCSHF